MGSGLPSTTIVGLPDAAVRESRDRVRSALKNSGFIYPDGKVVINLAPGGLNKNSSALDLPIAISILAATGQVRSHHLSHLEFLGELGLFGELRSTHGTLPCALAAAQAGRHLIAPRANAAEFRVLKRGSLSLVGHLNDVGAILQGDTLPTPTQIRSAAEAVPSEEPSKCPLFDQVVGQQAAKRALSIAAAGGHHLLMVGPPGTGKSMLARGFCELLPALSEAAQLEVAAIYSAAGMTRTREGTPPFRDPHHSASAPALIGGGQSPTPGEVALAHHGVLFLDEMPHFKPSALNLLREPIETGQAVIVRANYKVTFPSQFQLLAAMNPCPAGRSCNESACRCSPTQVQRYQNRISGPLLDRIDIHVRVPALPKDLLVKVQDQSGAWHLRTVRQRVVAAQERQKRRQGRLNATLNGQALHAHMVQAGINQLFLENAIERFKLSARSYHKLWRIALTIADLEGSATIRVDHINEALGFRALDWEAGVT